MRFFLAGLLLFIAGCAGLDYGALAGHMRAGNCRQAAEYVEKAEKTYGNNQRLLYLLDAAQVNMLCGNYEKSNGYFHKAEELAEDLYTKSVTREAAAFLLNDYTRPYAGEDFERALINLFSAINYLMLNQYDEALVECRRLDANLLLYNDKYEQKNVYKEDAFGRYLSAMIYEAVGNPQDAFIDYYKAYNVFKAYRRDYGTEIPPILVEDLMTAAAAAGRLDEVKDIAPPSGGPRPDGRAKVVFIHLNGGAPVKEEDKIILPFKEGPITLAFPRFVVERPRCRQSGLLVSSSGEEGASLRAAAYMAEDVNAIAVKNLDDRKGRVVAKTLARAVVKQVAIRKATDNEMGRVLLNVANIFIERADTRSWRTLPGEIYISRAYVPEGTYEAYAEACGRKNSVGTLNLKAGETRFLLYDTIY